MTAPFERIVLLKLRPQYASANARETLGRSLAAALGSRASVGLPADAAAEKSWDVSIVVRFDDREAASAFDPLAVVESSAGVPSTEVVEVVKGWAFRTL